MNIYELFLNNCPTRHLDYYDGFIIVAKDARNARKMAEGVARDGKFINTKLTSCLKLGVTTGRVPSSIRMSSFNAG